MKIDKKHIEWLNSLPPHLYTTIMERVTGKMSIMQKLSWQITRLDEILFNRHGCWFNFVMYKFYSIPSEFILWIYYKYNKRRERILGCRLNRRNK